MVKKITLVLILALFPVSAYAASLTLTWTNNANNEDGFKVERKIGQTGTFIEVGQVAQDVSTFNDPVTDGELYCYRVNAFNAAGVSPWSAEACGTILTTPLGPTTITITVTVP